MASELNISSLIAETAKSKAEDLIIQGYPLETLPPEIGNLRHLKCIRVTNAGLRSIPTSIGELKKLEVLDLSDNKLTSVPPEIGKLQKLTDLDLSYNNLTSLPKELARLRNLQAINLFSNNLSEFPTFSNSASLSVHLGDNKICEIPASVGRLTGLEYLEIAHNEISKIAPEIGDLTNLTSIYLDNNKVSDLPPQMGYMRNLSVLSLDGNPLAEPLPEMVRRGVHDLLAYLRGVQEAGIPQFEAKLLLVGEGNVGKTSLVAALHGEPFVQNRSTTHGIEITRLELPHPFLNERILLNTWDFGGQEVYRITHQFFFSRRCLYILVWRPREGQEENAIEEWCRRIRLRVGDDARILIVATHADERRAELDYPYLQRQFGDVLVGRYEVDNLSGRGIAELREAITELAAHLPQMGEQISQRWIHVRDEIKKIPEPQITFDKFAELSTQYTIDTSQQFALIGMLHDLGQLIYFGNDDGLRDIIVLQPEWLTKAISYVLEDSETEDSQGILDHQHLASIWQNPVRDTQYQRGYHSYFLRMMEKFDVSYRIPDEDKSLIAQLVPYEEPKLPWHPDQAPRTGERQLTLICNMSDVAPGLMAWLTVRNHRFATGLHWRRGVFLMHRDHKAEALLIQQTSNQLLLVVRAPSPDYFFSILRDSIESLIRLRWNGLSYDMSIPCPHVDATGVRCTGQFELRTLQKYRERDIPSVRCARCIEQQNVTELLTGFALEDTSLKQLLDAVNDRSAEIRNELLVRSDDIKSHQSQIAASQTAKLAGQLRALMQAVGREMPDCPRLFTILQRRSAKLSRTMEWHYNLRLTLWCEHPGEEHPWPKAQYDFTRPKNWLVKLAPYLLVLTTVLRDVVPVGGAALGLAMSDKDYEKIKKDLDLMKELVEHLPVGSIDANTISALGRRDAAGAELRSLRALLIGLDPAMRFGDLRRILMPTGDYLWICPQHYPAYDPGLPVLP